MPEKNKQDNKLHHAVNTAAAAGIISLAANLCVSLITRKTGLSASTTGAPVSMILISVCSMLLPLLLYKLVYRNVGKLIKNHESKKMPPDKAALITIAGACICIILNYAISRLAEIFSVPVSSDKLRPANSDIGAFILMLVAVLIAAPVCEELLTRGCITSSLLPFGKSTAVIIPSVIFSLLHSGAVGICFALLSGCILGIVRISTGSLISSIAVHIINNGIAFIMLCLENDIKSLFLNISFAAAIVIFAVCAVVYAARYNRNDSEKISPEQNFKNLLRSACCPLLWLFVAAALYIMN